MSLTSYRAAPPRDPDIIKLIYQPNWSFNLCQSVALQPHFTSQARFLPKIPQCGIMSLTSYRPAPPRDQGPP
jgi:hypothetical protein